MYSTPRAGAITLGKCNVQTVVDRFGPDGRTAVRDRERRVSFLAPIGNETPFTWPSQNPDKPDVPAGKRSIYRIVPAMQSHRNNLTALSQTYNLYFAAYQGRIFVYRPGAAAEQLLTRLPELQLVPRKSNLGIKAPGYLDPHRPHCVNHIVTGMFGEREIVVACYDNGEVVAYDIKEVWNEVLCKDEERSYAASKGQEVLQQPHASTKPFLSENVGRSAWGLAIHSRSRLIAVSSNLHEITVFAMSFSKGLDSMSKTATCEGCGDTAEQVKRRQRPWRIIVALGEDASNIPNVSFLDDEQGEAEKVCGMDIHGKAWIADIWKPMEYCTYVKGYVEKEPRSDWNNGWGVIPLPLESFLVVNRAQDLLGGDVNLLRHEDTDPTIDINPLLTLADDPCTASRRSHPGTTALAQQTPLGPAAAQAPVPQPWSMELQGAASTQENDGAASPWEPHPMLTVVFGALNGPADPSLLDAEGDEESNSQSTPEPGPAALPWDDGPTTTVVALGMNDDGDEPDSDMPDLQSMPGDEEVEDDNEGAGLGESEEDDNEHNGFVLYVPPPVQVFEEDDEGVDEDYDDDGAYDDDSDEFDDEEQDDEDEDEGDEVDSEDEEDEESEEAEHEILAALTAGTLFNDPNSNVAGQDDPESTSTIPVPAETVAFANPYFPGAWPGSNHQSPLAHGPQPLPSIAAEFLAHLQASPPPGFFADSFPGHDPGQPWNGLTEGPNDTSTAIGGTDDGVLSLSNLVNSFFNDWDGPSKAAAQPSKKRKASRSARRNAKKDGSLPSRSTCCRARYVRTNSGPLYLPMIYLPHEGFMAAPDEVDLRRTKVNKRQGLFKNLALSEVTKRYRFLLTYSTDLALLAPATTHMKTNVTIPEIRCTEAIPQPWDVPMQADRLFHATDRLSMLAQIPELSLLVIGSATGRVLLVTPTRMGGPNRAVYGEAWEYGFRIEAVLPRASDERKYCHLSGRRPLHGLAVGPAMYESEGRGKDAERPGGPKRFRVVLHYRNHDIWTYEVGREKHDGRVCIF